MNTIVFIILLSAMYLLAAAIITSSIMTIQSITAPGMNKKAAYIIAIYSGALWPLTSVRLIYRTIRNKPTQYEINKIAKLNKEYDDRLEKILNIKKDDQ